MTSPRQGVKSLEAALSVRIGECVYRIECRARREPGLKKIRSIACFTAYHEADSQPTAA
jgi:hypothetical protein